MSIVLRPRTPGQSARASLLNYDELSALAHKLHTGPRQTRHLILLGLMERAPRELRICITNLVNECLQLSQDLGRSPPPLKFTGEILELPSD